MKISRAETSGFFHLLMHIWVIMTQFHDDYEGQPRSLVEIEDLAAAQLGYTGLLPGDWVEPYEFMSAMGYRVDILSSRKMNGAHAFANARVNTISISREMSKGLRDEDLKFRYTWGHEMGHLAMHRGLGLKARLAGSGNKRINFISRECSIEFQAWLFSRALFVPRGLVQDGLYEGFDYKIGIPMYAIEMRQTDIDLDVQGILFSDR